MANLEKIADELSGLTVMEAAESSAVIFTDRRKFLSLGPA